MQGIYILANDRVMENSIALLNSIRYYDSETPIVMIPYNNEYQKIAELISSKFGVTVYEDLPFLDYLDNLVKSCGNKFFDRPNLLRKLACWFGPFDEFLYIDTDIVVFEKIIANLTHLSDYDFLCYDYQYRSGITQVFQEKIREIYSEDDLKDVFNTGFWGSKKNLISEQDLSDLFSFCSGNPDYFYLLNSDQTIINYLILNKTKKRLNLSRQSIKLPGNWAGSKHFQEENHRLIDPKTNLPLKFIHWAGVRIEPKGYYWDIWKYYRYLNEDNPPPDIITPQTNQFQRVINKLKNKLKF